jgi:hypothetical protein
MTPPKNGDTWIIASENPRRQGEINDDVSEKAAK